MSPGSPALKLALPKCDHIVLACWSRVHPLAGSHGLPSHLSPGNPQTVTGRPLRKPLSNGERSVSAPLVVLPQWPSWAPAKARERVVEASDSKVTMAMSNLLPGRGCSRYRLLTVNAVALNRPKGMVAQLRAGATYTESGRSPLEL
jgi:hypothetical protein